MATASRGRQPTMHGLITFRRAQVKWGVDKGQARVTLRAYLAGAKKRHLDKRKRTPLWKSPGPV